MRMLGLVVVLGLAGWGCGGDDGTPGEDGGGTDGSGGMTDAGPVPDGGDAGETPDGHTGEPCTADADCDNGIFCDGVETCDATNPRATADGCVTPESFDCDDGIVCTLDSCVEEMRRCNHAAQDADGDGHTDAMCLDA